jgi:hypothetical protein
MRTPPLEVTVALARSKEQITAIKKSYELSDRILTEHPEIIEEYRRGEMTHLQLAEKYAPEELSQHRGVTLAAIYHLIKKRLPYSERKRLSKKHTQDVLRNWWKSLDEEQRKDFLKANKKARAEKGKGNEGNPYPMLKSQGMALWDEEQRTYLGELLTHPQYRWQSTSKIGYPNYNLLIEALKERFGIARTKPSIDCQISYLKERGYQIPRKLV